MGGDSLCSSPPSSEDVSLSGQNFPLGSLYSSNSSGEEEVFDPKLMNGSVIEEPNSLNSGKLAHVGHGVSSIDEAVERQRLKVYSEVLRTYEGLQSRIDSLEEARNKILSYAPGSWADKAGGMYSKEYDIPNATSLLLIGPAGSGKSSLVNKIYRALGDDVPGAQVSCNSSTGGGTFFLHEYMIPKGSGSFCVYDTRSLSSDSSENQKAFNRWMKKGVRHGELIRRNSDSTALKAELKCKARRCSSSRQYRQVDYVIFVVNGLSVLESMDSADEKKKHYCQMIATNFNNPLLSFKDDKPVVVVTHGDLLLFPDRVRVRIYLGELLGIPPTRQVFDIPENNDSATTLAIYDMLSYSLERADRNFPTKDLFVDQVYAVGNLVFWLVMAVGVVLGFPGFHSRKPLATTMASPPMDLDWSRIRHLWLD